MDLTCDNCGSIHPGGDRRCSLCGESLSEEAYRREHGSVVGLLLGAIGATALLFVAPAPLIKAYWFHETDWTIFGAIYVGVWVVGAVVGQIYKPKDDYDLGLVSRMGLVDNPLTLRDDYDRSHAVTGLILLPMNIVVGLWIALAARVMGR